MSASGLNVFWVAIALAIAGSTIAAIAVGALTFAAVARVTGNKDD